MAHRLRPRVGIQRRRGDRRKQLVRLPRPASRVFRRCVFRSVGRLAVFDRGHGCERAPHGRHRRSSRRAHSRHPRVRDVQRGDGRGQTRRHSRVRRLRMERRPACRGRRILRIHQLRRHLHRGAGVAESPSRHAHRHPRFTRRLHGSLLRIFLRDDRTRERPRLRPEERTRTGFGRAAHVLLRVYRGDHSPTRHGRFASRLCRSFRSSASPFAWH